MDISISCMLDRNSGTHYAGLCCDYFRLLACDNRVNPREASIESSRMGPKRFRGDSTRLHRALEH